MRMITGGGMEDRGGVMDVNVSDIVCDELRKQIIAWEWYTYSAFVLVDLCGAFGCRRYADDDCDYIGETPTEAVYAAWKAEATLESNE